MKLNWFVKIFVILRLDFLSIFLRIKTCSRYGILLVKRGFRALAWLSTEVQIAVSLFMMWMSWSHLTISTTGERSSSFRLWFYQLSQTLTVGFPSSSNSTSLILMFRLALLTLKTSRSLCWGIKLMWMAATAEWYCFYCFFWRRHEDFQFSFSAVGNMRINIWS